MGWVEQRGRSQTGPSKPSRGGGVPGVPDLSQPIFEPGELAEAEQPSWWRALAASVRDSPAWPYIQESLAGQVVLRFFNDWGNRDASLIAWAGLVSVLPLLLAVPVVTILVLRLVGVDVNNGQEQVLTSLIPDGPLRSSVDQALRAVSGHAALLSLAAVLGLIWRGSALFRQLEMCLSRIAGVRPRRFAHRLLLAMVLIGLIGLVSLATTAATVFFFANPTLQRVAHPVAASIAAFSGQVLIGLIVGFGVFMFIYGVIPNHAYRVRQVWPGAAFATVCFELLSLLFPLWAAINRNFGSYGTDLALSIVLVAYFYLFGVIVVLGADINAILWDRTPHPYPGELEHP